MAAFFSKSSGPVEKPDGFILRFGPSGLTIWLMPAYQPNKITRWPGQHRRVPGHLYSEGARQLWRVLRLLQSELRVDNITAVAAERIGVGGGTILRWLYGERAPERSAANAIHAEFGIDPLLWDAKPHGGHAKELPPALIPMRSAA
jgi:hypothetical protein